MRHYRTLGFRDLMLAGAALTALAAPAAAQDSDANGAQAQEADAAPANEGDGEIVVVGVRRSLEDALETKRRSTQIIDSLSSEGVGKLPDLNLAESLQRVPGVQINRSAARRLGTVSIRGLPGDFSQTLINGQYLASPDVSNFSFGTVRSEVFSGIDVIKAQSADQQTGGLSGLINLRTGSAMTAKQGLAVNVDGTWEELTDKIAPGGAITAAYQIVPGVLAVRAAFGYKQSNFRIDNFQISTYDRIAGAATADNSDDVLRPREIRLPNNLTKSDSYSGSFGIEWRPSDTLSAEILGFYNDFTGKTIQNEFLVSATPDTVATNGTVTRNSIVTLIGTPQPTGDFGSTISRIRIENPQVNADTRGTDDYLKTGAITGKLKWESDDWQVEGTVHYTKATRAFRNSGYQAIQRAVANGNNGIALDIDTGSGRIDDIVFALTGANRQLIDLSVPYGAPIAPTYREIRQVGNANRSFLGNFRMQDEEEDELAFSLDIRKEFENGPLEAIRVGGLYRDKSQNQTQSLSSIFGIDRSLLNNDFYDYSIFDGGRPYLNGKAPGVDLSNYGQFDVRRISDIFLPLGNITLPADNPDTPLVEYFIGPDGFVNFRDSTAQSLFYENDQRIYGGYAMLDVDQRLFDWLNLRGNVGVRYEKSERATTAQGRPEVLDFNYENLMPSANAIFEIGNNLLLRASYTETIRRPQVDSFAVLRSVAVDGTGQIVTANLGAADLEPFKASNIDISLEWYNRAGSSVSILGFRKRVSDYAGTTRVCPADGGDFGFGPLTTESGICRTVNATPASGSFPAVLAGATVNINVTANQDSFTLEGFEVSVQQNLDFLPAPFNGFGGQVNYTQVNYESAGTFRLGEISKHTLNAIVYYEIPEFSIRAAYNYRSGYFLASAGTQSGADRSVKARSQLDLSAAVNLTDRLSLTAEAFNVTNELLIEFEGASNRVRNYFEYGRTISVGARYRF